MLTKRTLESKKILEFTSSMKKYDVYPPSEGLLEFIWNDYKLHGGKADDFAHLIRKSFDYGKKFDEAMEKRENK